MVNILIVVIAAVFTVPFFLLGLIKSLAWLYHNHLKKSGYVNISMMKENFQIHKMWVKPVDNEFKVKFGKEERKFDFSNQPGDSLYSGNELYAIFDEKTGEQFKFREKLKTEEEGDVSSRDINTACDRSYNLGFIMGTRQTDQGVILLWLTLGVSVCVGLFLFFKFGNLEAGLKVIADKIGAVLPTMT